MSENGFLSMEKRANGGLNMGGNKMLKDLEGDTLQGHGLIALRITLGLFHLRIATTSSLGS